MSRSRATIMRMTSFVPAALAAPTPSGSGPVNLGPLSTVVGPRPLTFEDLVHAGVAEVLLHGRVLQVAIAAVQLQRLVADLSSEPPSTRAERARCEQSQSDLGPGMFAARTLKPLSVAKSLAMAA